MKPILVPDARPVLEAAARDRALLVFDFDGTLAPIVPSRDEATLPATTHALLRTLSLLYTTAVLSGRARADLRGRVAGIPFAAIVGNHGAEAGLGPLDREQRATIERWREQLSADLAGREGIEIEDKHFSLAVHYRSATRWTESRRLVMGAVEGLPGATAFGGRAVVNVVPEDAPHKGSAVEALRERIGAPYVVYVGDDRTDEDAFRSRQVRVGVRVGRTCRSAAQYYVPRQEDVDELLRAFVCARLRLDGRGEECDGLLRAASQERPLRPTSPGVRPKIS